MWPFKRNVRRRRLEVRKHIPTQKLGWWRRFRQAGGLGALLLLLAFFAALVALDASVDPTDPYRVGQYLPRDIRARLNFLAKRSAEQARDFTPAVFRFAGSTAQAVTRQLQQMAAALAQPDEQIDGPELIEQFNLTGPEQLAALREKLGTMPPAEVARAAEQIRRMFASIPVVRSDQAASQRSRPAKEVLLAHPDGVERINIQDLVVLQDPLQLQKALIQAGDELTALAPPARAGVLEWLARQISRAGPLYTFDPEATELRISQSVEWVRTRQPELLPTYLREQHLAGEVLARASAPGPLEPVRSDGLTASELSLLKAEHQAYHDQRRSLAPLDAIGYFAGRGGLIAALLALLAAYVAKYYRRIVENHWRAFSLLMLMLLMLIAARLTVHGLAWDPHTTIFSLLIVATIASLVYDQRFALTICSVQAALLVLILRGDIQLLLVLLGATAVAILQLQDVRSRTKLIRVAAVSGAALAGGVWLIGWVEAIPWTFTLDSALRGLAAAVLVGFLLQGLLPMIERIYRFATSMTLLEWCDASKPLLKRLAMEAPGTYNHSLQLGAMCEAAAEAIGARGLLARVGAYYHDIGKIHKPPYFIENQADGDSKHARLSPAMSLLIIIGHVKDGLELAREYGLPRVLHEFISTHHGKTLVQYFYRAATEQSKDKGSDRLPEEVEFRYPGPKPSSREAAILMLADAAESSVRSMSDPTPGRIENQVHTMVTRRMTDGQLDSCNLTLREVHEIEVSLVKSLCSFYHARIAYPTPEGEKPSAAEKHPRSGRSSSPQPTAGTTA
ncbi:MAG: HD family phosphohydrolase [Planctomycetota bacterium]